MFIAILKIIFLILAIMYTFTCFGRVIRRQAVHSMQTFLMALGVAGFVVLEFLI